ncbi:MAG TPA: DUF721 domain-containing protein [Rickettsiales bacterium]|nr:DUF721 domain-containing protein [Rickettsiales bacterium]
MSRKSYGVQHIENKLTNLLKPLFSGNKQHFLMINNLTKNWEKIIGIKYAKLCYPKSINFAKTKQGKLTIAVFNSAAGFAIENNSEILLEKIAILYGYKAIHKITIKQETRESEKKKEEIILSPQKEEDLQNSIKNVKDKDLAQTLANLGRDILKNIKSAISDDS